MLMNGADVMQPLAGLFVLDFSTLLPGPMTSLMLAEAGAEVLKIEPPQGDDMRRFPPIVDGHSAAFAALNHGKDFLRLDLKSADAIAALRPHLERADILIEQFRPGVMARLGLGYEALRAINPGLIYCSITGYGQAGPRVMEAGHDLNYIARTGMLGLSSGGAGHPVMPPLLAADIAGGTFPAVINILLALRQRDRSGEGCHLDIAMADTPATFLWHAAASHAATGDVPRDGAELFTGGSPRYRTYATADGRLVAVGALEEKFWQVFCNAIGLPEGMRGAGAPSETVIAAVAERLAARTAAHWRTVLEPLDCCVCVVATLDEAMAEPQFILRGLFQPVTDLGNGRQTPRAFVPVVPQFRR